MFFFNGGSHDEGAPKVVIFHQIQHDGGAPGGIFFSDFFTKFSMTGARREGFFFKGGSHDGGAGK